MKITTRIETPQPPPKTYTLELDQKEVNALYSLLRYFDTTANENIHPFSTTPEFGRRVELNNEIGFRLAEELMLEGARLD